DLKPLYNTTVTAVRETRNSVEIAFKQNGVVETRTFDAAVVATTLPVAIDICGGAYAPLTKLASTLKYVPGLTVGVAMKRKPDSPAFTVLVPSVEDSEIALAFLDHNKSPDRAPEGKGLVDFHWETSAAARMANASDEQIIARTMETSRRLFPEVGDDIEFAYVKRWSASLPFTSVGSYRAIGEFVRTMNEKGLVQFAGDYMSMAGQNTAVEMGNRAASRIDKIFNGAK
ncbi:MAG: FAD-dependent oxidoreductase, partial [Novosphingobium sp.]